MQHYFTQIQNKICENCDYAIRGDEQQFLFCGMPGGKSCMIEHFLPELVEVINSFDALPQENPIIEIRCKICSKCNQFKYGSCPLTGVGECTLDNNLHNVLLAIGDSRRRLHE